MEKPVIAAKRASDTPNMVRVAEAKVVPAKLLAMQAYFPWSPFCTSEMTRNGPGMETRRLGRMSTGVVTPPPEILTQLITGEGMPLA